MAFGRVVLKQNGMDATIKECLLPLEILIGLVVITCCKHEVAGASWKWCVLQKPCCCGSGCSLVGAAAGHAAQSCPLNALSPVPVCHVLPKCFETGAVISSEMETVANLTLLSNIFLWLGENNHIHVVSLYIKLLSSFPVNLKWQKWCSLERCSIFRKRSIATKLLMKAEAKESAFSFSVWLKLIFQNILNVKENVKMHILCNGTTFFHHSNLSWRYIWNSSCLW